MRKIDMKPAQVAEYLRHTATKIDNSKNPDRSLVAAELRRILAAMVVNLTEVTEIPQDEEGSPTFEVIGSVNGTQFSVVISINPEERLWDVMSGQLPEGSDADVMGELMTHPVYKAAEARLIGNVPA
jgi:hypothetical protein